MSSMIHSIKLFDFSPSTCDAKGVSEENIQTPQAPAQKEERTDELDVIGGLIVKLFKYFGKFYRKLFKSQQYS